MAGKGGSRHLKRLAAPRSWVLQRKAERFVEKPSPGPHSLETSVTLGHLLTNTLKYCKTSREVRLALRDGLVRIDGVTRKASDFPIGLMDVIEFPTFGDVYRMLIGKWQRLIPVKIGAEEKAFKLCRIQRKMTVKRGITLYTLHDGRSYLAPKEGEGFGTGWTLKIGLPNGELMGHIPLGEGVNAGAVAGRNCGRWGIIEQLIPRTVGGGESLTEIAAFDGVKYLTPASHVFIVGDSKPWIKLPTGAVV